ncbi:adipocyte plasma membrane-associated protein Hemomucin-like isoform X2 [Bombyx mori]|uniref:adipocyte plasma membrane-associated protein Hemomucin-like isoform X2 n=1 Tax=Bombyx mori TaxID=7091 RepID=UPI002ED3E91B
MAKDMLALKFIVLNILIMVCVGVKQECSPFRPDYSSYQEFQYCSTAYYLSLSLRFTNIPVGATSYRLLTARHDLLHSELVGEGNISANENCFDESVHILPKRYNLSLELYLNYKGDALCKAVKILDLYNNEADCSNTVYYNIGLIRFNLENSCELRQQTTEKSGPSAPLPTAVRTSTTRSVTSHPMTSWSSTDATVSTTRRKPVLTSPSTPAINSTDKGFGSPISPAAPSATTVSTVTVSATSPTPETLSFKAINSTDKGFGSPISPAAPSATTVSTVTVSATSPTPETLSFKAINSTDKGFGSPISPAAPSATTVSTVTVSATSPTPETLSFKGFAEGRVRRVGHSRAQ